MRYVLRVVGDNNLTIPGEIHDSHAGLFRLEKLPELSLDRNLTIDTKWVDFAINCAATVPLGVLANAIYDHVFRRRGKLIEKDETEIHIECPDGTLVQIRTVRSRATK